MRYFAIRARGNTQLRRAISPFSCWHRIQACELDTRATKSAAAKVSSGPRKSSLFGRSSVTQAQFAANALSEAFLL